jgi:hypothetical protein
MSGHVADTGEATSVSGALPSELYHAYEEYSKTLRTWFVAYGVGAPVLFLTNEQVASKIASSGDARRIAGLFLLGAFLQIVLAIINKACMWVCFYGERQPGFRRSRQWKVANWIADQFVVDVMVDLLSLLAFATGTWLSFNVLAGP